MKLLFWSSRKNYRTTLLDLHRFGVLQIFRRPSLLRVWEPARIHPANDAEFAN